MNVTVAVKSPGEVKHKSENNSSHTKSINEKYLP